MNLKLFSDRFRDNFFLLSMFFIFIVSVQAQKKVSGTVTSGGAPLPSANVLAKGTTTGVSTDIDGKFSFTVPSNAQTLVVSYLGYATKEVAITSGDINITLAEEKNTLEEVVVNVGYGTQKKSVVTGAISKVTAKDLEKITNGGVGQALQGRASGVTVAAQSGQPGSLSSIKIRGISTFNLNGSDGGSDPLWVVDGIVVDGNAMNFINQNDIESFEILKDASAAIYGTRAARGVILITTKKGKSGKLSVNYNGYTGISAPAKTLNLLNATQYGALMNEKSINDGGALIYSNLGELGLGTDWQKQIFNYNAARYNHDLSISGGNDVSNFYISFGLQDTQGIVASDISNFTKKTVRINSNHKVSKLLNFGETFTYEHEKALGIGNTNSEFGGPLSSAINLDPTTPITRDFGNVFSTNIFDANGNPYSFSSLVDGEMTNPLAYIQTRLGNFNYTDQFLGNVFAELNLAKGLKFKTSIGGKLAYWGSEGFTPVFKLNNQNNNAHNSYARVINNAFDYVFDNTLTYSKSFENHNFSILLGQSATDNNKGGGSYVNKQNLPVTNFADASFNFEVGTANTTGAAWDFTQHKISSLFSRLNYDYKSKYLFTGILRRDGSTRFGANKKFATFPSISLGWVVSKEDFWKANNVVNTLKLKGSWGKSGNDNIGDFAYLAKVVGGFSYYMNGSIATGYAPNAPANKDLGWEETTQTDLGIEAKLFNNWNISMGVFQKKVSGILQKVYIPAYAGYSDLPSKNLADMENKGLELELAYKKSFGNLNFSANGNISCLKNKVTYLGDGIEYITDGAASFQSMGPITRTQVGESYNSFYGFQTAGIFQNQAEIDAYPHKDGAQPGDIKWLDANNDGKISDDDKQFLGSPLPKYTFGLTLNFDYKSFDLMIFTQGATGNKIFQGLRRNDLGGKNNYSDAALSRWHGEGTSDSYPRLTDTDKNGNFSTMSDFYLQKGDYARI